MTSPRPSRVHEASASPEVDAFRFAAEVVADVSRRLTYREDDLLAAVHHHAHWGHVVSGLPLDREFLFRRDVIAVAVQQLPMRSEASLGRRRAVRLASRQDVREGFVLASREMSAWVRRRGGCPGFARQLDR